MWGNGVHVWGRGLMWGCGCSYWAGEVQLWGREVDMGLGWHIWVGESRYGAGDAVMGLGEGSYGAGVADMGPGGVVMGQPHSCVVLVCPIGAAVHRVRGQRGFLLLPVLGVLLWGERG